MADSSTDRRSVSVEPTGRRRSGPMVFRLTRAIALVGAGVVLLLGLGFCWFVQHLPRQEIELDRAADGIVVLTGGSSRVTDAMELMAAKHGQRLLISGANPSTNAKEITRLHPEFAPVVRCCVDFDRSINTLGNAVETRKWAQRRKIRSLIVVTSGYHMPRALAELEHQLPGVALIPFPVFSEHVRAEPWWPDGVRRVGIEYLKFLFAHVRMLLSPGAGRSN